MAGMFGLGERGSRAGKSVQWLDTNFGMGILVPPVVRVVVAVQTLIVFRISRRPVIAGKAKRFFGSLSPLHIVWHFDGWSIDGRPNEIVKLWIVLI